MYYFYKTTNTINGRFYYGSGSREVYIGSGLSLDLARKKYGDENFIHERLRFFNSRKEAFAFEDRFLKLFKISSIPQSYNIIDSAFGGDNFTNHPYKEAIIEKRLATYNKRISETGYSDAELLRNEKLKEMGAVLSKREDFHDIVMKGISSRKDRWEREGYSDAEITGRKKASDALTLHNQDPAFRKKQAERMRETMTGKKLSAEWRASIGKASKGRKQPDTYCKKLEINGIVYRSQKEAVDTLNIAMSTLKFRLNSKNFKTWFYL